MYNYIIIPSFKLCIHCLNLVLALFLYIALVQLCVRVLVSALSRAYIAKPRRYVVASSSMHARIGAATTLYHLG